MLNSNVIQNNISSLHVASSEAEKLKKESSRNQENMQNKINKDVLQEKISVNATNQDSNPQKILDQEQEGEEGKSENETNIEHHHKKKAPVLKDQSKGNIVDISC